MATHLKTELVLDALNMAFWQRRPKEIVHHSDHGTQNTSIVFGHRCRELRVRPSMESIGHCYDNALCESFFARLECERLDRRRFKSQTEARMAVFDFIEGFYQPAATSFLHLPDLAAPLRKEYASRCLSRGGLREGGALPP